MDRYNIFNKRLENAKNPILQNKCIERERSTNYDISNDCHFPEAEKIPPKRNCHTYAVFYLPDETKSTLIGETTDSAKYCETQGIILHHPPIGPKCIGTNMRSGRGPTIVTVPVHSSRGKSGIHCCCCQCCTCIHLEFLKTGPGIVKLAEVIIGFFCQSLALKYGMGYSGTIGPSFQSFLTNVTWCFMTTLMLLFCYVFSPKSVNLIKSSFFEVSFNIVAAFSYLSTCSYLGYAVNIALEPIYMVTPYYQVYPAMSAAYMAGSILGLIYAYDAYKSYRYFKGYRY